MAADEECRGINLKLSYESYLDDEDDDDADAADDYNGFFFLRFCRRQCYVHEQLLKLDFMTCI